MDARLIEVEVEPGGLEVSETALLQNPELTCAWRWIRWPCLGTINFVSGTEPLARLGAYGR